MSGDVRHHWALDYERFDPEGRAELDVILHGVVPIEDGSIRATLLSRP